MAGHHTEGTATGHEGHHHHVLPLSVYVGVYLALLVLTYLTVQVSFWDLGPLSLPVAMLVALVKAGFVVGFFMHLRYDDKFLSLIFFSSLFFIAVFLAFTLFDLSTRGKINADQSNFRPLLEQGKLETAGLGGHHGALTAYAAIEHQKKLHKEAADKAKNKGKGKKAKPKFQAPPGMLALGKTKYTQLCALCHGPQGMGNGPGAKGLKVKPAAYGRAEFRLSGGTQAGILKILKNGSTKNGMASYAWMPLKERNALAYYIRSMAFNWKQKQAAKKAAKKKAAPAPRRAAPTTAPAKKK